MRVRAGYACELDTRGLGGHTEAAGCGAEEAYLIVRTCPWSHVWWDAAVPATGVRWRGDCFVRGGLYPWAVAGFGPS